MGREGRYCTLHIAEDTNSLTKTMKMISTNFQVCWIRAVCFHPPLDLPQTGPAKHLASHLHTADQLSGCFILSSREVPFKRKNLLLRTPPSWTAGFDLGKRTWFPETQTTSCFHLVQGGPRGRERNHTRRRLRLQFPHVYNSGLILHNRGIDRYSSQSFKTTLRF